MEQFPFIGSWLNIYHTKPDGGIPLHIDGHRLAAFNIPISGCDETSQTIYYEPVGEIEKVYKEAGETGIVDVDVAGEVRPSLIHNVQQDYYKHKKLLKVLKHLKI